MLLAETFRMGGHATHDEREARDTFPADLFEQWGRRDPIGLYESWLLDRGGSGRGAREIEARPRRRSMPPTEALADRDRLPAPESALEGVYARERQPMEECYAIRRC